MQDLSSLAADSMWVTSQDGGNMTSDRPAAMSAPGTDPVVALSQRNQGAPHVGVSNTTQIEPGDNGKPDPEHGAPGGSGAWKMTSTAGQDQPR
jgi:hypothetical protein